MKDKQHLNQTVMHVLNAIPGAAQQRAVLALRAIRGENGMKSPAQGKPMTLALLRATCP